MFQLLAHSLTKRNPRVELLKYIMDWIMHLGNYKPFIFAVTKKPFINLWSKEDFARDPLYIRGAKIVSEFEKNLKVPLLPSQLLGPLSITCTIFMTGPGSPKLIFSLTNVLRNLYYLIQDRHLHIPYLGRFLNISS